MKLSLKKTVDITFIALAFIIFILVYTVYDRAKSVKENRAIIYKTSTLNILLEKVLSSTIDIETSSRGYAITGKSEYLEIFNQKNKEALNWIDSIKSLKLDNPNDVLKLDTIEDLLQKKITFSDSTISKRRKLGMESAAALIEKGRGKEIMDSIKSVIAKYQEKQINLTSTKLKQTEENIRTRNFIFTLFVLLISFLIFLAYLIIRKNAKKLAEQDEIQKNLIEELSTQNNQLNDFSNIIAHNLRSPTATIAMLIDSLDEKSSKEETFIVFKMLKQVSDNLNEVLDNLLDIISLKSIKKLEIDNLQFADILKKTSENLQGEIVQKKAQINADFSAVPTINYPKIYLESIMHNLVSNALKYSDPNRKPTISIRSQTIQNSIYLTITDNGLGIDLDQYGSQIFGMNKVFHKHPDAKGLGLFMTKMQVERFGGNINVKSEVNKGTTFTIKFN